MAPAYEAVCTEQGWEVDQAQLDRMAEANTKRLQELDDKIKDAGGLLASSTYTMRCSSCGQCLHTARLYWTALRMREWGGNLAQFAERLWEVAGLGTLYRRQVMWWTAGLRSRPQP